MIASRYKNSDSLVASRSLLAAAKNVCVTVSCCPATSVDVLFNLSLSTKFSTPVATSKATITDNTIIFFVLGFIFIYSSYRFSFCGS